MEGHFCGINMPFVSDYNNVLSYRPCKVNIWFLVPAAPVCRISARADGVDSALCNRKLYVLTGCCGVFMMFCDIL